MRDTMRRMRRATGTWWKRLRRAPRPTRSLPLRLWLVLAVAAITGGGFLAQLGMTVVVDVWDQQAADARLASVRQIIGTDAARWRDPAWQRRAETSLDALGVDVAVFSGQPGGPEALGQLVYATAGARQYLDAGDTSGISGTTSTTSTTTTRAPHRAGAATGQASGATPPAAVGFQRIVIASSAHAAQPTAVAFLWYIQPPPGALPVVVWPVVELGTFAVALAIIVWLMGQPVLRPLAEMSQAADNIAGGDLDVRLAPSPVREIAGVSAALEGMSASLREALARQDAADEQRRLFVGAIAHDLRTPLFMLRGYLQGLEQGVAATPEKMARYLGMCRTQADALERLIADLFAFTRLEYLEQEPERAPLELGALLRQTAEGAQPLAAAREIALTLDGPREPCPMLGDSQLLARAVGNLLDNALRYTPEHGQVRVRWEQRETALVFAVEDSGPGLAAQDLPHLFTPLYRGDASRSRQTGGAGLGLAIAQRILRAHGGTLAAANRPEGGAVFTGTLPVAAERRAPLAPSRADHALPAGR